MDTYMKRVHDVVADEGSDLGVRLRSGRVELVGGGADEEKPFIFDISGHLLDTYIDPVKCGEMQRGKRCVAPDGSRANGMKKTNVLTAPEKTRRHREALERSGAENLEASLAADCRRSCQRERVEGCCSYTAKYGCVLLESSLEVGVGGASEFAGSCGKEGSRTQAMREGDSRASSGWKKFFGAGPRIFLWNIGVVPFRGIFATSR